jgi:hypothetical protein
MTQRRHIPLIAPYLAIAVGILVGCSSARRFTDGRSHDEHREIVKACMSLLRYSSTNEAFISSTDPRVPPAIRALKPHEIIVIGNMQIPNPHVVIIRAGEPAVYQFWLRSSYPKTWILYVAGPGYNGLEELDYAGSTGCDPIQDLQW